MSEDRDIRDLFMDYLKEDAVDWGDPDSEYYSWPLVPDAPQEAVDAYMTYVNALVEAAKEGRIIN